MKGLAASLLAGVLALTNLLPQALDASDRSVVSVRVLRDVGEERGTAVLIGRDDRDDHAVLHFLTSSCLFRTPQAAKRPPIQTIELLLGDGLQPLRVERGDVFMPSGGCIDIAVFRVTAPATTAIVPQRVMYEPPPAGAAFLVSGHDAAGRAVEVGAHIRFRSTLLAIGDRDVSTLSGCVGGPAMLHGDQAVFGVVSECEPGRAPVIALLSAARRFIERYVPPQDAAPSPSSIRHFVPGQQRGRRASSRRTSSLAEIRQ
jgi:hypothetical protein